MVIRRTLLAAVAGSDIARHDPGACSPVRWTRTDHDPSGAASGGNGPRSWNHRRHAHHLAVTTRWSTATPGPANRGTRRQDPRVPSAAAEVRAIQVDGVVA